MQYLQQLWVMPLEGAGAGAHVITMGVLRRSLQALGRDSDDTTGRRSAILAGLAQAEAGLLSMEQLGQRLVGDRFQLGL